MILKYFIKSIFYLLSVSIVFLNIACEDDPLLEPQSDSEVDAGSYGMLYLSEEDSEVEAEPYPEVY